MTREGALHIRLKRGRDGPPVLTCRRPDGSATWLRVQEFFPLHDLMHFAVETTLGLREAFFGLIANGWNLEDFQRPGAAGRLPDEARWAESIVGLLDRERVPGFRWTLDELNAGLRMSLDGHAAVPFRDLTAEQLEGVRSLFREVVARWREVAPGESLELKFAVTAG